MVRFDGLMRQRGEMDASLGEGARGYGEECRVACVSIVLVHIVVFVGDRSRYPEKIPFKDIHYTPNSDLHQLVGS